MGDQHPPVRLGRLRQPHQHPGPRHRAYNWVTDIETDLGDAEVTRDGKKLAAVRGYDSSTHIVWYTVNGNVLAGGKPPAPDALCMTGQQAGFDNPTWSPDGASLAWNEPDGIWVKRQVDVCGAPQPTLVLPGGSEADWGPAAVNPGPRPVAGGAPTGGGKADRRRREARAGAQEGQAPRPRPQRQGVLHVPDGVQVPGQADAARQDPRRQEGQGEGRAAPRP